MHRVRGIILIHSDNSATGVYSITGTDSAVTTAVDGLVFTPTTHQVAPGSSVTTTFTIEATDTAGGTSCNSTTTVGATAANDPPVITGAVAGQTTTDEATITPFSGVSVSDVDFGQTETVTVTLSSAANGTLSDVDGGSFNSGTGVYSITGTDSAVTTALDALVFTPTAHQVAPGGTVTTTFTIQATDTAGGTSSNSTTTVIATAVNDPPVITGAMAGQTTTDEATITPFSGVTISDPDFDASETVTITLTAGGLPSDANGTLSGAGLTKTGTGTYTLTAGAPAAVTAALQALVFTPTAHEVAPGDTGHHRHDPVGHRWYRRFADNRHNHLRGDDRGERSAGDHRHGRRPTDQRRPNRPAVLRRVDQRPRSRRQRNRHHHAECRYRAERCQRHAVRPRTDQDRNRHLHADHRHARRGDRRLAGPGVHARGARRCRPTARSSPA